MVGLLWKFCSVCNKRTKRFHFCIFFDIMVRFYIKKTESNKMEGLDIGVMKVPEIY